MSNSPDSHYLSVLLLEPEQSDGAFLDRQLSELGFEVIEFSNALDALAALSRRTFLLAFFSEAIAELDPGSLARLVKQSDLPGLAPGLVLVQSPPGFSPETLRSAGFDAGLLLPANVIGVRKAVGEALTRRRLALKAATNTQPTPTFDANTLKKFSGHLGVHGEAEGEALASLFLLALADNRRRIDQARQTGNTIPLELPLHSLKSTAHLIGALRLSELCSAWGKLPARSEARLTQLGELRSEINRADEALRAYLKDGVI